MSTIYKIFVKILIKVKFIHSERIMWLYRNLLEPKWFKSYLEDASLNHPHRKLLMNHLHRFEPFESVIEVGCCSGPNLYLIAEYYKAVRIHGIDINSSAINYGRKWFNEKNLRNVYLSKGDFSNLINIPEKSFDIIITDAVLIYAQPQELEHVFTDLYRICKKAMILIEQHTEQPDSFNDKHWIHNYNKFIKKATFHKIPKDIWGGNWGDYGYIIEVII